MFCCSSPSCLRHRSENYWDTLTGSTLSEWVLLLSCTENSNQPALFTESETNQDAGEISPALWAKQETMTGKSGGSVGYGGTRVNVTRAKIQNDRWPHDEREEMDGGECRNGTHRVMYKRSAQWKRGRDIARIPRTSQEQGWVDSSPSLMISAC